MDIDALELVLSFVFTWFVGLSLPAFVRFILYRRSLDRAEALAITIGLGLMEMAFFVLLGSQSKTHAVLLLIGWVAYRILQTKRGRFDKRMQYLDTVVAEVSAPKDSLKTNKIFPILGRLDTIGKRIVFLPLIPAIVLFLGLVLLPPPISIDKEEAWSDGAIAGQTQRTIKRLLKACASVSPGYASFSSELEILNASTDIYYGLILKSAPAERVMPATIDFDEKFQNELFTALTKRSHICFEGQCIKTLTPQIFERVLQTCSKPVVQSLTIISRTKFSFENLNGREDALLTLILVILLSSLFSIFYTSTIGYLVSWIKNG